MDVKFCCDNHVGLSTICLCSLKAQWWSRLKCWDDQICRMSKSKKALRLKGAPFQTSLVPLMCNSGRSLMIFFRSWRHVVEHMSNALCGSDLFLILRQMREICGYRMGPWLHPPLGLNPCHSDLSMFIIFERHSSNPPWGFSSNKCWQGYNCLHLDLPRSH